MQLPEVTPKQFPFELEKINFKLQRNGANTAKIVYHQVSFIRTFKCFNMNLKTCFQHFGVGRNDFS